MRAQPVPKGWLVQRMTGIYGMVVVGDYRRGVRSEPPGGYWYGKVVAVHRTALGTRVVPPSIKHTKCASAFVVY